MKEGLVSIIIPVYNVAVYLQECVQSVLNQTYTNLEIILIDDGSTDTSLAICNQLKELDNRIVLHEQQNSGLSAARNTGVKLATGTFIAFVDSDDIIGEEYIQKLYNALQEYEADISVCDFYEFGDENLKKVGDEFFSKPCYSSTEFLSFFSDYVPSHIGISAVIACNKLYKATLCKMFHFPLGMKHEDMFVIHHIVGHANKIAVINDKLYGYRRRSGSITSTLGITNYYHQYLAQRDRTLFFKKRNECDRMEKSELRSLKLIVMLYKLDKRFVKYILIHFFSIRRHGLIGGREILRLFLARRSGSKE